MSSVEVSVLPEVSNYGIQELCDDEIDAVSGGIVPLVAAAIITGGCAIAAAAITAYGNIKTAYINAQAASCKK